MSFGKTQIKRRKTSTSSFDVNCACLSCFVTCFYIRETYFCCIHGWDLTKQIWWWITLHRHLVFVSHLKFLSRNIKTIIGINYFSLNQTYFLWPFVAEKSEHIDSNNISITKGIKTEGTRSVERNKVEEDIIENERNPYSWNSFVNISLQIHANNFCYSIFANFQFIQPLN